MELPAMPREFHAAVEREDWEAAALYALVTAAEWIEEVGRDAAEALIQELEPLEAPQDVPQARKHDGA